jgi:hypothetical protein
MHSDWPAALHARPAASNNINTVIERDVGVDGSGYALFAIRAYPAEQIEQANRCCSEDARADSCPDAFLRLTQTPARVLGAYVVCS